MPLVLGIDSGARSTRVELRDSEDGREYGFGQATHAEGDRPGEQDPQGWWQGVVDARLDAGGALGVHAVAVAAQQPGLLVLDAAGHVLGPARVGEFPEAATALHDFTEVIGGTLEWIHACGFIPRTEHSIAKLAWLQQNDPAVLASMARLLAPHDWLTFRLSRSLVTDRGDASVSGYWSVREERWRPDLLALLDGDRDWATCLPRALEAGEPAGDREGVVIAAGTGEPMACALGVALRPRDVLVNVGDSITVSTVRDRPTEDERGAVDGFADATGRYLPQVSVLHAGAAFAACARLLDVDSGRFDQLALSAPPGAQGVVFVAGAAGGRGASLHGLNGDTGPELVARAVVEGIAFATLDALDALRDSEVPVSGRVVLVGPGARSHALRQAMADLLGRPVGVPKGDRSASGACVQAAAVIHGTPPEEIAAAWGLDRAREVEPNPRVDAQEIRDGHRHVARSHGVEGAIRTADRPEPRS